MMEREGRDPVYPAENSKCHLRPLEVRESGASAGVSAESPPSWKHEEAMCAAFSSSRPDIKDTKWNDCYLQHRFKKAQQMQPLVRTSRMETLSPISFQGSSKWGL